MKSDCFLFRSGQRVNDDVMTGDEELLQIGDIVERLAFYYPSISRDQITHTVRLVHKRFEAARIRDFVPLLVEKAARRDIDELIADAA